MATKLYIWQGDIAKIVLLTVTDENGTRLNLATMVSGSFSMIDYYTKQAQLSNQAIQNLQTNGNALTYGNVAYEWQAGDTDRCGLYRGFFKLDFGSGPETWPQNDDLFILISPKG